MRNTLVAGIVIFLLCCPLWAAAQPAHNTATPSPALMSRILAAWSTGNPANAAPFYDKSPDDIFYDIAPLQYHGWAEYQAGAENVLAGFEYLKLRLNDNARVHRSGNFAWGTATWTADAKLKNGNKTGLEGRWTVIWEKKGGHWLIVHEHLSVPWAPEPESRHR